MESSEEPEVLREGEDYYFEDGLMVLTARYLLRRGYCCEQGCRHCPYGFLKKDHKKHKTDHKEHRKSF
jgi:hypothetical protein